MELHRYRFRCVWRLTEPTHRVYDVLADLMAYPRWWPQIRAVRRVDGSTAEALCRSTLPYDLRLVMHETHQDRAAGLLEAQLTGDLEGWSRWELRPAGPGTVATFEEDVVTRKALLRRLAPVARPALRANHTAMMRGGERGLRAYLAGTAGSDPAGAQTA